MSFNTALVFFALVVNSSAFNSPEKFKTLSFPPKSSAGHTFHAVEVPSMVDLVSRKDTVVSPMNGTSAVSSITTVLPETEHYPQSTAGLSLATLKKRLDTKEDKLSLHKISSIAFVVASTSIMCAGIASGFQELPEWIVPFDRILCWSLVGSALTSIPIAISHRQGQPEVRDQFIAMGITLLFQVPLVELYAPWAPDIMNNDAIIRPIMMGLILLQGYGIYEARKAKRELMSAPHAAKNNKGLGLGFELPEFAKELAFDSVTTILVPFIGSFFFLLLDETKDRSWFLSFADSRGGVPAYYYENVFTSIQLMWGAFFVSLRDKKAVQANVVEAYNLITTLIVVVTAIVILFPAGTFNL